MVLGYRASEGSTSTVSLLPLATGAGGASETATASSGENKGRGSGPIVFVSSQNLYYDSIIIVDPLPPLGPFQLLEMGRNGLQTDFGPGNVGYGGGRWNEDFDGDGQCHYFLCPLLGPGRTNP